MLEKKNRQDIDEGKKTRHNSNAGKTKPVTIWMLEKQNPSQFGWMKTKPVTI